MARINNDGVREELLRIYIESQTRTGNYDFGMLVDKYENFDIVPLKTPSELVRGDCVSWTLGRLGLNLQTRRWPITRYGRSGLPRGLKRTRDLGEEVLVAYYFPIPRVYAHYGVGISLDGKLYVVSRWGMDAPLFRHPLEMVLPTHGDRVHFYKKA